MAVAALSEKEAGEVSTPRSESSQNEENETPQNEKTTPSDENTPNETEESSEDDSGPSPFWVRLPLWFPAAPTC